MHIGHLEIFCADPVASIPFYRDALGFTLVEVQHEKFVWLTSHEAIVLLRPGTGGAIVETYQQAPMAIVLYTSHLDDVRRRLVDSGVAILGDDGPGCLTFRDPDGHWFQLVDPAGR